MNKRMSVNNDGESGWGFRLFDTDAVGVVELGTEKRNKITKISVNMTFLV